MSYLKDREIWLSKVPTGNPPAGYFWKFIQNGKVVVRDSSGNDQMMIATNGSQAITGSLIVTGGITGTISSASYVQYSNVANKPTLVSGSGQISFNGITNKPTLVSGSSQVTFLGLSSIPSGIVSGSAQVAQFGYATTGSNGFNGSQSITGSLTVTGQVIAQTLNVQQVTSSIVYSSGSNIFGNNSGNTHRFTGSVSITGSLNTSIAAFGSAATVFLTSDGGIIKSRTAAQTLSDIAALPLAGGTLTGPLSGSSANFSGNVGINTSTPDIIGYATKTFGILGVGSDFPNMQIGIPGTSAATADVMGDINFFSRNGTGAVVSRSLIRSGLDGAINNNYFSFFTMNAGTLAERLKIASNGTANFDTPSAIYASFNSTNASGGYIGFRRSGTSIGYLGNSAQLGIGVNNALELRADNNLYLTTTSGTLSMLSTGNVGIGTSSSGALLRRLNIVPATDIPQLYLVQSNNNDGGWMFRAAVDGHFRIISYQGSESPKLTIRYDTGNVGIGTDSPSQQVGTGTVAQISGGENGSEPALVLGNYSNNTAGNRGRIDFVGTAVNGNPKIAASIIGKIESSSTNTVAGALAFETINGSGPGGTERMRITSGGNMLLQTDRLIGLNTSDGSDTGYLAIAGAGGDGTNRGGHIYLSGNERVVDAGNVTIAAGNISSGTGAPGAIVFRIGDGTERMRITSDGKVIVRQSNFTYPVSIEAQSGGGQLALTRSGAYAEFYMGGSTGGGTQLYVRSGGSGGVRLDAGSTGWVADSDIRLKDIEKPIENAVESLSTLQTVYYSWKDSENEKQHLGLIAQEVEAVFPEIVSESSITGMKGVNYVELIPVLVKAIQEQQTLIESLKSRIEILEQ